MSATDEMTACRAPAFDAADLFDQLLVMTKGALDALPYGVIGLSPSATVEVYNTTESQLAGLAPERVIGRHFFHEVGVCMNNDVVASRYEEEAELDEFVPYVITFRMRPAHVRLRLLKRRYHDRAWLVLDRATRG